MKFQLTLVVIVFFFGCESTKVLPLRFAYHEEYSVPLGYNIFKTVPGVSKTVRYTGVSGNTAFFEESREIKSYDSEGDYQDETVKKELRVEPFAGDSTALIEGVKIKFLKVDNYGVNFKILDYHNQKRIQVLRKSYGAQTRLILKNFDTVECVVWDETQTELVVVPFSIENEISGKPKHKIGSKELPSGTILHIKKSEITSMVSLSEY
ncbi:MAG: hypothetical protein J0L62_09605 [Bacteroidetes bacterium]|nr:hypothetical protein [Bacteroidota bacterium]